MSASVDLSISSNKRPGHVTSLKLRSGARCKNLDDTFEWNDIPMFAVLTGKSGVGKTAVLEAIRQGVQERLGHRRRCTSNFNIDLGIDEEICFHYFAR
jgi:predicted GTPase